MSGVSFPAVRVASGTAIVGVLLWRVGTGPFLGAVRGIAPVPLACAGAIAVLTTVCCAWRWQLVAGGLGVRLSLGHSVAACYRSQFLNTTLPGGVLGDVHRAISHRRASGDYAASVRAVGWDRFAGQIVQICVAAVALTVLPSPVRVWMPYVATVGGLAILVTVVVSRVDQAEGASTVARLLRTARADVRNGLLRRRAVLGVLLASAVAVGGHTATFVIAARVAGVDVAANRLVPLALLALMAMALPANVGGWGPREGVAAWSFSAAGLGAAQGVAVAAAYGVLVFVASLPGFAMLLSARAPMVRSRRVVAHG